MCMLWNLITWTRSNWYWREKLKCTRNGEAVSFCDHDLDFLSLGPQLHICKGEASLSLLPLLTVSVYSSNFLVWICMPANLKCLYFDRIIHFNISWFLSWAKPKQGAHQQMRMRFRILKGKILNWTFRICCKICKSLLEGFSQVSFPALISGWFHILVEFYDKCYHLEAN